VTVYHVFAPSTGVYPDKPGPFQFPSRAGDVLWGLRTEPGGDRVAGGWRV